MNFISARALSLMFAFTFTTLSGAQAANIASIVDCPVELNALSVSNGSLTRICRQYSNTSISTYDSASKQLYVSENGVVSTLAIPYEALASNLNDQIAGELPLTEIFYNSNSHQWVAFSNQELDQSNSIFVINENQMGSNSVVLYLYSSLNNLQKDVSFVGNQIQIDFDQTPGSTQIKNEIPAKVDLVESGLENYYKNVDTLLTSYFPNEDFSADVQSWYAKCAFDAKCLKKEYRLAGKSFKKKYKHNQDKNIATYVKFNSFPYGFLMDQYNDFLSGCVNNPKNCEGFSLNSYLRYGFDLDNQNQKSISYGPMVPATESILTWFLWI